MTSSLVIPADLLAAEILKSVPLYTSIHLDGSVHIESNEGRLSNAPTMTIDELVINSVNPMMCEDEPEAGPMLRQLAERLIAALAAVDEEIKRL